MKAAKQAVLSNVSDPTANNINRFAGDSNTGIKLTPTETLTLSFVFIVAVFILHILGKIVGFASSSPASAAQPVETTE